MIDRLNSLLAMVAVDRRCGAYMTTSLRRDVPASASWMCVITGMPRIRARMRPEGQRDRVHEDEVGPGRGVVAPRPTPGTP